MGRINSNLKEHAVLIQHLNESLAIKSSFKGAMLNDDEIVQNMQTLIKQMKISMGNASKIVKTAYQKEIATLNRLIKTLQTNENIDDTFGTLKEGSKKELKVRVVDPFVIAIGISPNGNWYWQAKNGLKNSYSGKMAKEKMRQEARQVGNGKFIDKAIKTLEGLLGEDVVNSGSIPSGPESVGKPDFMFKGNHGFECDPDTFSKCINGKKKYKRWNVFLNRDDALTSRVKGFFGQSYRNTDFVLRNNKTGEMIMGRNGEQT